MASSLAISRITWALLGVVIIALIVSVTSLVLVVMEMSKDLERQMRKERNENGKRVRDLESEMMKEFVKERKENDKLIADIKTKMTSWMKRGEWSDRQLKNRISSFEMKMKTFENLTEHTPRGMVAFSVGSTKPFTSNWARIPMAINIYNPARYFGSNNEFRAPRKGVYSFHFGAMAKKGKVADIHLFTHKVGEAKVDVARAYGDTSTGYGSASGSVMVQMDKWETASIWLWGRSSYNASLFGSYYVGTQGPTTLFMGKLEYQLD